MRCCRGTPVTNIFSRPRYWPDIFTQMDSIGFGSLPIVVLTGFFTGCVLALQSATSLQQFGAVSMTGNLVALSMVKELGPVLTGLMISGPQRLGNGLRARLDEGDRADRRDAGPGNRSHPQAGYAAALRDGLHALLSHHLSRTRSASRAARWSAWRCWG